MTQPTYTTRLAAIAIAIAMAASACTDPDTKTESKNSREDPKETTTTTVDERADDRAAVIAAREAAYAAKWASLDQPPNPDHPALAETLLDPRLHEARFDAESEARIGSYYRAGPQSKVAVQSVAFAGDDVAFLETCEVLDQQAIVTSTGKVNPYRSGTWTVQRSEEMRRDAGHWKLIYSFVHGQQDGVTGCATETPPKATPTPAGDTERQAVTAGREAAERDWLTAVINPQAPPPAGTHTGNMLEWFTGNASDGTSRAGTLFRQECPFTWYPEQQAGHADDACVTRVWDGHAGPTYLLRAAGIAMRPDSSSTVTVQSVTFPDVATPQVAYARTCRTYHVGRADGQRWHRNAHDATVRTTEVMRHQDGTWKLTARWDFDVDLTASPCT